MKRQEANDIVQHLLPALEAVGIKREHCKVDVATKRSGALRGDVWISRVAQSSKDFESRILALIEAKHRKCELGDAQWRDAMDHGRSKAEKQGLGLYIVTNCVDTHRAYNAETDDEVSIDGRPFTSLQPIEVLEKMSAQVTPEDSRVAHRAPSVPTAVSEARFRKVLPKLADTYRSCGLKGGDDRIDPTVSLVLLKLIGEREADQRTLDAVVATWPDYGSGKGNYRADFEQSAKDIFSGSYGDRYTDFQGLVVLPKQMSNDHYQQIYDELNQLSLQGCEFDVFGAIYEEFASQTKKKEFGEFYTRRHITSMVARLLLRDERSGHDLMICDPACGSGGFLTEAYRALEGNYAGAGKLSPTVKRRLQRETFWGFDNDAKSIARAEFNMFLVGDGHTCIQRVEDSLVGWDAEIGWEPDTFDYILANPPMGSYGGEAKVKDFSFSGERRCELMFMDKIVTALKSGGEFAVVLPDGALEAPTREGFRRKLMEACDVQAIVSLTRFAFAPYTKEKTYVVFGQKKQPESVGELQESPVWHFIVDYDGFANSDKRFRTKWHDDLPELEGLFDGAVRCGRTYASDRTAFEERRDRFERDVNRTETQAGLTGKKSAFVDPSDVNEHSFHNLLSEFHLRPVTSDPLPERRFDREALKVCADLRGLLDDIQELEGRLQSEDS